MQIPLFAATALVFIILEDEVPHMQSEIEDDSVNLSLQTQG